MSAAILSALDRFVPRRGARSRWMVAGVTAVALYLLSAGPALMLAQRRVLPTDLVGTVYFAPYAPFELATSAVPGGEWCKRRYVEFWDSMTPKSE